MTSESKSIPQPMQGRFDPLLASIGMVVFALFAHQRSLLVAASAGGLLVVAATIGRSLREERAAALFGLRRVSIATLALALILGGAVGLRHRQTLGMSPWLSTVEAFAIVACLVGGAEELLYRGWLLQKVRDLGWPSAVLVAAVAHAAYKTALFALPPGSQGIDHTGMMLWTVAGGIALGILRVRSGSVVPCLFAHAAFDFVVYGALAAAPWWVWS